MKNVRALVILLLLAIAAPFALHHRAWFLATPAAAPATTLKAVQLSRQSGNSQPPAQPTELATRGGSKTLDGQMAIAAMDLPGASSSLPLLSVIGFGIFVGGLISALRTRSAHK